MYSKNVLQAVGSIAQTQTAGNKLLVVAGEHLPLAATCESYNNFVEPNGVAFSYELAKSAEGEFVSQNQITSGIQQANFDNAVSNTQEGLKSAVALTRNVIVPAVNALQAEYSARQNELVNPNISLQVLKYHGVHSEPALVNHVQARYATIADKPEYRSFRLGDKTIESIIEMVAVNNPHLDQGQVTEWLLEMGATRIAAVWAQLFKNTSVINPRSIAWLQGGASPETADEILLAYCLCGHLRDTPIDPIDDNVSLDQWNLTMQILHEFFGSMLLRAYKRRVQMAERGILVLSPKNENPINDLRVLVKVNGDIYEKALEQGITVEGLLGASCYFHQTAVQDLLPQNDQNAKAWQKLYPLIRQAAVDRTIAARRRTVTALMNEAPRIVGVPLPVLDTMAFDRALQAAVIELTDSDYNSPFGMFGKLVTKLYFDNPIYPAFMDAFARYSRIHPDATPRELAFFGLVEITALWLSQQVQVQSFTPVVDPNATLPSVSMENVDTSNMLAEQDDDDLVDPLPLGTNPETPAEEPATQGDALEEHEEEEEQEAQKDVSEEKASDQGQLDQAVLDRRNGIEPEDKPAETGVATGEAEALTTDEAISAQQVDEQGNPIPA